MFDFEAKRKRAAGEEGFTLIELLVVIIILGILAAVVVFSVGGIGDKGQGSACKIDERTLRTAEEAYAARPGGGGTYGTQQQLKDGGFLSDVSSLHDVTLGAGNTFTITPVAGKGC
jgi:general secretion pathway protein G